jgi:hypothetical protein
MGCSVERTLDCGASTPLSFFARLRPHAGYAFPAVLPQQRRKKESGVEPPQSKEIAADDPNPINRDVQFFPFPVPSPAQIGILLQDDSLWDKELIN